MQKGQIQPIKLTQDYVFLLIKKLFTQSISVNLFIFLF